MPFSIFFFQGKVKQYTFEVFSVMTVLESCASFNLLTVEWFPFNLHQELNHGEGSVYNPLMLPHHHLSCTQHKTLCHLFQRGLVGWQSVPYVSQVSALAR